MNDLWLRIRAILLRRRVEAELDDELELHVALQTRKYVAAGMSEREAARRARREFGPDALVKEQCRDQRRVSLVETTLQDIRYALRGFRHTPVFSLTVIATIALGLGINTAVFTIFNAYVLRPISVRDPYSLFEADWINRSGGFSLTTNQYDEFRKQDPVFSDTFASRNLQLRVDGHMTFGELVSGNYFRMLGVGAAMGRPLVPADSAAPGREPVAVLSYDAWQGRFGADPEILGKKISIRGFPLEIVGVAPPGFVGLNEMPQDFWAPLSMLDRVDPDRGAWLRIYGRLRRDLSVSQAEAALSVVAQRITADQPSAERATGAALRSRATSVRLSPQALLIMSPVIAAFAMVLLIACANVANMMLARAMARQREIGIRLSLGAARGRLIRQLLTESILLAIPAAAVGFAISRVVVEGGVRIMFATLPTEFVEYLRVVPLAPDLRVLLFMMGGAIVAAVLFGLAPALQATRSSVVQAARGDFTNQHRPSRLRNALVVVQITGCAGLLIAAGVLLRGANRLSHLEIGMRTRDTIELRVQEKARARALAQLASEPDLESVAASALSPLDDWFPQARVVAAQDAAPVAALHTLVSPEYFSVFDIPILQGRAFSRDEGLAEAAVAIVSESAARTFWPNQDPIGRVIRLESAGTRSAQLLHGIRQARVIGVTGDTVTGLVDSDLAHRCVYLPTHVDAADKTWIARVHGDPEAARRRIDAALEREMPGSVEEIHKMQEFVIGRQYPFRAAYWVSAVVGILALLLTIAGVYGVMAYLVAQRTKEIGIRMAMGASERQIVALVLRQSVHLAVLGLGFGMLLALGGSRVLGQYMIVDAYDGAAYLGGIAVVLAACLGAAFFPSRRAARIDPIATLRYD